MAKTLEELRADLARDVGLFFTGVATGGAVGTVIDTNGLKRLTENDVLNNGLVYIRTDAGGLGAAPEGQARFITDYVAATQTISVEYNWTAAVAVGDVYEIYRVPLGLAQWDKCINEAIQQAWPEVWERQVYEVASAGVVYLLPAVVESVEQVRVAFDGALAGYPAELIPRHRWRTEGTPGTDLYLYLDHTPPALNRIIDVVYRARYGELAAGEETDLDYAYLMAAAKANLYEVLAGETGNQADESNYLRLLSYWRQEAQARKQALYAELLGFVPAAEKGKK